MAYNMYVYITAYIYGMYNLNMYNLNVYSLCSLNIYILSLSLVIICISFLSYMYIYIYTIIGSMGFVGSLLDRAGAGAAV
jgi:hypothetical protein